MELSTQQIDAKLERHMRRKVKLEELAEKISGRISYREQAIRALSKQRTISLNFKLNLNGEENHL